MSIENGSYGWQLHPMDGDTGQAFMGIRDQEKIFLKKNTSPFLAALSIHGITPRLKWTKRTNNGDVLSAQEWFNGRSLSAQEMNSISVAKMVKKIHSSQSLLSMLKKVGGQVLSPSHMLNQLGQEFNKMDLESLEQVDYFFCYLRIHLPAFDENLAVVNHGDMSRKNWLLTEQDELYLVDWDEAVIADLAFDLGSILYHYIPSQDWIKWLNDYGLDPDPNLKKKIDWYGRWSLLHSMYKFKQMDDQLKAQKCLKRLDSLSELSNS